MLRESRGFLDSMKGDRFGLWLIKGRCPRWGSAFEEDARNYP